MPFNAEVLAVQLQRGDLILWAKGCSADQVQLPRVFCVYGTGHPMFDVDQAYIGTVQDGGLVWHVFEVLPRSAPLFDPHHAQDVAHVAEWLAAPEHMRDSEFAPGLPVRLARLEDITRANAEDGEQPL